MPIYGAALMGGGSGPAFAAIGAIYPVGAVCTCSYNGQTLTAKDTSGRALFLVPSAGQWLVKATNGGQEVEDTVSITTQGQVASVTLAFFSATIQVTFPTDCTSVTCTKGDTVLSVPSGSLASGEHTFSVHEAGEWTVSCTDGSRTARKTVSITADGQSESVTLRYEIDLINDNDTTGGWSVGYKNNSTPTITTEADKITVSSESTDIYQANICTAVTKNLIDLSGFTKITVNVTDVNILSAGDIRVGLVKNRTDSSLRSSVKITTKKEYSLSITPGSYYVAIYVKGDIDGAEVKEASYVAVDKLVAS